MFRHSNTRQDMKKHKLQDQQISANLVVEIILISIKTGNWFVVYLQKYITEVISIYLQGQTNVYGNNNVHLNQRECKNPRTCRTSNLQAVGLKHLLPPWKPKVNVIVSASLVKCPSLQRNCSLPTEIRQTQEQQIHPLLPRLVRQELGFRAAQGERKASHSIPPSLSVRCRSCISRTATGTTAASAASSATSPWSTSPSC